MEHRVFSTSAVYIALAMAVGWVAPSSNAYEKASSESFDMLVELDANVPYESAMARLDSDCGDRCGLEVRFARGVVAYNLSLSDSIPVVERVQFLKSAVDDFEQVVGKNPNDPLVRRYLGLSLIRERADFDGAAQHFAVAWKAGERATDFADSYAYILIATGDYQQAARVLEGIPEGQRTFDSHYLLAVSQLALERFQDAAESAERASSFEQSARAHILRASALSRQGKYADALRELDHADSIDNGSLNVSRARIAIYRKSGDRRAALAEAKKASRLHPDDQGIRDLLGELEKHSK